MDHSGHSMDHSGHSMDHSGHGVDHSAHMSQSPDQVANYSSILDANTTLLGHHGHNDYVVEAHGMDMMKMYFHFGYGDDYILFQGWKPQTVGGLIGSMVGIFILALFYEGLKYFREYLIKRSLSNNNYDAAANKTAPNQDRPVQYLDHIILPAPTSILSVGHITQTFLHMFQLVISYCLMLIFMTYNVWLCIAVTLGAGCGFFLFGWKKAVVVDVTEHCH